MTDQPATRAVREEERLTEAQYRRVIDCLGQWFLIRGKHDHNFRALLGRCADSPDRIASQLHADVWHSALLLRMLLQGKPPLPEPPPLRHSYPDYAAVEGSDV